VPDPAPQTAPKPKAIVVEGDPKIRAATCEILRREKFDVTPCPDPDDVLNLAKEQVPVALMLDVSLQGLDWRAVVKILGRCRDTRPVKVILICPPEFTQMQCDTMKSAGAFDVLLRPLTRTAIAEVAAAAVKASDDERARLDAALAKKPPVARAVDSNNSLLVRQVICPFHKEPLTFNRYTLRGGKVLTDTNVYDLTVYTSAAPGADFVNFHPLAVVTCPRCLFSSVHVAYFKDPNDAEAPYHALGEATAQAIRATAADRRAVAGDLPADFFTESRTLAGAVTAYELAIATSNVLIDKNRYSLVIEHARIGNSHLRLAHLKELLAAPTEQIDAHYRAAMTALADAYTRIEGPGIHRIGYQMLALALRFGEDKTAYQYLNLMIQADREPALPKDDRSALQRYLPRAQRTWEDRDQHRSPLLESANAA
jgi:FixJ family two-component response regulator